MPRLILRHTDRPPYEAAADLLATMAFPASADEDKRQRSAEKLSAYILRLAHDQSHPGLDLRLANERHVALANGKLSLGKSLEQRLQAVQKAAAIAAPQIAARRGEIVQVKDVDRPSHRSLVAAGLDLGWHNDRSDFRDRAWRPTLPVLHMAVALYETQRKRAVLGFEMDHMAVFLDPAIVREAVDHAETLESVVSEIWRAQIDVEKQWQFRLIS